MEEMKSVNAGIDLVEKVRPLRGIFEFDVIQDGKVIRHVRDGNLIVDGARVEMAHLIGGDGTNRQIAKIAFGTNGTAANVTDTEITDAFEKAVSGHAYPETGQVQFAWSLAKTENNNQAIMEFGLLCADGTLFARFVLDEPINKQSVFALQGTWTIVF
jgi:hypothetical protein